MISNRFPSAYRKDPRRLPILYISPTVLFWFGCIPPSIGTIVAIFSALILDQDKITNYKWTCGRAFLPSFSRIINLDFEGLFWQFFIYYHIPLRILELTVGVVRYGRLRLPDCTFPRMYNLCRWGYLIFGVLEMLFVIGLSAVGEKEHGVVHVFFFYTFGIFAFLFFLFNTICHSQSLWYLNPCGRWSYRVKVTVCIIYFCSVPLIATFYALYWKACITFAYEMFALTEYIDAFVSMLFHGCTLWDIRYKARNSIKRNQPNLNDTYRRKLQVVFRLDYIPHNRSLVRQQEDLALKRTDEYIHEELHDSVSDL